MATVKKTVYEIVTEKVLETLEKGTLPWRKPWVAGAMRPCNAETGRQYSGGNMFLLSMLPFATPAFLTYKQIEKAGARIADGQNKNYFPVFYWNILERKNALGKVEKIPMLRYFLVWNVEQVTGYTLPEKITKQMPTDYVHDPIAAADAIVAGFADAPAMTVTKINRACYSPSTDTVTVPVLAQYPDQNEFYSVLFHELAHSTGHHSRLNRKEINDPIQFGSHAYSLEEMVAELTAAFLCAESGIDNTLANSAAYIKGWHSKLESDPKLFWTAAGRAQKAADYILGSKRGEDSTAE
jgi:antirestriction protein ArdC